jgi:hypothetical protein
VQIHSCKETNRVPDQQVKGTFVPSNYDYAEIASCSSERTSARRGGGGLDHETTMTCGGQLGSTYAVIMNRFYKRILVPVLPLRPYLGRRASEIKTYLCRN